MLVRAEAQLNKLLRNGIFDSKLNVKHSYTMASWSLSSDKSALHCIRNGKVEERSKDGRLKRHEMTALSERREDERAVTRAVIGLPSLFSLNVHLSL